MKKYVAIAVPKNKDYEEIIIVKTDRKEYLQKKIHDFFYTGKDMNCRCLDYRLEVYENGNITSDY